LEAPVVRLAESSAGIGFWDLDTQNNEVTWSSGLYRLLGLRPGADITPDQALFYAQSRQGRIRALVRRCIRTGKPFSIVLDMLTARQQPSRMKLTGQAIYCEGRIHKLSGILINLTDQREQEQALQNSRNLLDAVTSASTDLIAAVDCELNLLQGNQAFAKQFQKLFGHYPRPGDNLSRLLKDHPNERRMMERLWQRAFERDSFLVEMPLAQLNPDLPVYEMHYRRLVNGEGETFGAVRVARDTSARTRAGNSEYRIRHDPVTGLLNRREFLARLDRTLRQKRRKSLVGSLLYLDLDDFDKFNEEAGNSAGDRYLRGLAGSLGIKVRQRDALARLSGDTFVLLMENCPESRARQIAGELIQHIRDYRLEWQGHDLHTTATGGLLILDGESDQEPEQLLVQAADLCHTARIAGRDRYHTAHAVVGNTVEGDAGLLLEQIHYALDNHKVLLEFQSMKPVNSASWGDHIEILARIPGQNEDERSIQPGAFLPIAERFDLAKRLDREIIRQTLGWLEQHPLLEPRLKYCGFNLSLASTLDDTFAEFMAEQLKDSRYAPEVFCLEIREAHATQYPEDVTILCEALHHVGCRVALDGAGASVESYSLAAKLPVDIIKLDRNMMQHLEDDPVQEVMVEALHKIAEAAGKVTVATFIENDDTLRHVRALGIHYGQGYRLFRPQPLSALKPAAVELATGRIGG
jgi:diguanylate cyclase (GGDEF)-like protein